MSKITPTMKCRYPLNRFPCTECTRIFDDWNELIKHARKEHDPNIDEVLANGDGDVTSEEAQAARKRCKEIATNYEAQARAASLGIDPEPYLRTHLGVSGHWIPCQLCGELCDTTTEDYETHLKAHRDEDADFLKEIRRLEIKAVAQEKNLRDKKTKKIKNEHIQGKTEDNSKAVDVLLREFAQMGKDSAQGDKKVGTQRGKGGRKRGAQGGRKNAKSSTKPLEAENLDKREEQMQEPKPFDEKSSSAAEDHLAASDKREEHTEELKPFDDKRSSEAEDLANVAASTSGEAEENEVEEKDAGVSDIFLNAMIEAHGRYLESSSASSAKRLTKLEERASQLSALCAASASKDSTALILKIVKAGIDYIFIDPDRRESFLKSAILKFASLLPVASLYDILNYLEAHSQDSNIWGPYFAFLDTIHKKEEEEKEEEDFPSGGEGSEFEAGKGDGIRFPNHVTGWEGEKVACKFFSSIFGEGNVTWINEFQESGKPYDLIVQDSNGKKYVEVKSTIWAEKDWFYVSLNEWNFAMAQGDAYIIARVNFSEADEPKVYTFQNIVKLITERKLKLALCPAKGR